MSWSFAVIGTPDAIIQEFDRLETGMTGQSLVEFHDARPALEALLRLNTNPKYPPCLHLDAAGHAYVQDGEKEYSTCSVHLRQVAARIVQDTRDQPAQP